MGRPKKAVEAEAKVESAEPVEAVEAPKAEPKKKAEPKLLMMLGKFSLSSLGEGFEVRDDFGRKIAEPLSEDEGVSLLKGWARK